ncbi:MAG: hypothetical protein FJX42_01520 [Alphaproteobacteria bacterium]|nr:hypothetical protein [Alphaproteobacteria bacterium]
MSPLFGPEEKKPPPPPAPITWVRNRNGNFYRLNTLRPGKIGPIGGGVFVVWHSGAKAGWVIVGAHENLNAAITALQEDEDVRQYETRGGLFITWAMIKSEYRAGIIKYLNESMEPLINRGGKDDPKLDPIPVVAPGEKNVPPPDVTA